MTIPASTVKAAKANLFTAIKSLSEASVLVSYDFPGPNQPDDIIVIGPVERDIEVSAVVGDGQAHAFQERYDITVLVSVFRGGDIAQTTFERASTLIDIVVQAVRQDMTLAGAVLWARPTHSSMDPQWAAGNEGRIVDGLVTISCFSQI